MFVKAKMITVDNTFWNFVKLIMLELAKIKILVSFRKWI